MGGVAGLTGTFGSGKSTVAAFLREAGLPVIDADTLAREALGAGRPELARVAERFGPAVLDADGSLDREALARIVFQDRRALAWLNATVHPYVREETNRLLETYRARPWAVIDVPLLFETGMNRECDLVAVVVVSERERFARLRRRGFAEQDVVRRLGMQMSQSAKVALADVVIDNRGTPEETRQQVLDWINQLQGEKDPRS